MTVSRRIPPIPRRWRFALAGLAIGVGATLSYLVVWNLQTDPAATLAESIAFVLAHVRVWLFATLPGLVALTWLGWSIGRRQDELVEQSRTDSLTELSNLAGHRARLGEEIARATRHGTPLSLLLVDVDHLKAINDERGHAAGDDALRTVSEALRRSCRTTDHAARIGGDEFAVLAAGAPLQEAVALAERIRANLRQFQRSRDPSARATVSIGVADLASVGPLPQSQQGAAQAAGAMRSSADAALYAAKEAGRDRVAARDGEPRPPRHAFARLIALG